MGRKLSKMVPQRVQNGAVNYLKIMLEFFQNLFKIFQKSHQNGVPGVLGPLVGPSEGPGGRGVDLMVLGVHFGTHLGPIWEVN